MACVVLCTPALVRQQTNDLFPKAAKWDPVPEHLHMVVPLQFSITSFMLATKLTLAAKISVGSRTTCAINGSFYSQQ